MKLRASPPRLEPITLSSLGCQTRIALLLACLLIASSAQLATAASQRISCRSELGHALPYETFSMDSCARCYFYMPAWAFRDKFSYLGYGLLYDTTTNTTHLANETSLLATTFLSPAMAIKWQQCCTDALTCCLEHLAVKPGAHHDTNHQSANACPKTWDGWTCWPNDAAFGVTLDVACPAHIYWKMTAPPCRGRVHKTCTEDGNWFSISEREWSNYTNCARDDIYLRRLRYSVATHLISVCCIIPALFIFNYYRQLSHTPRIRLHKHLFACLLLYAILSSLLKLHLLDTETSAALEDAGQPPDIGDQNTSAHYCLGLTMALRYFRSATYLWMFNEAFYLHQLIKKAFTSPPVNPLIALAYGLPLLMTIAYCVCRSLLLPVEEQSLHSLNATLDALPQPSLSFEGQTDVCWLVPARDPWTEWVINGPNLAILLVNFSLLVPIVTEIYKKAAAAPSPHNVQRNLIRSDTLGANGSAASGNAPSSNLSKASLMVSMRAATLLLPLYGLHYLVFVYRPDIDICWLSELYHYASLTLDGLQGGLVAVLFCFANNEVRQLLKRSCFAKRDANLYLTEIVPAPQ